MNKKEDPIKIIFYEPYPMGMGGNFLTQKMILERLDRRFFTPIVMAPLDGVALDYFRSQGIECVVMPPPGMLGRYGGEALRNSLLGRIKSAVDLFFYNVRLARFFKSRQINVVYANCVRAMLSVGVGARLAGIPSLLYVKGELANPFIDRVCFILASKILFFCAKNRDDRYPYLVKWYKKKIQILEIGLDPATISQVENKDNSGLAKELDINSGFLNTVVLAQLYRPKGQHLAILALAQLVKDFPRARLYFVGDHVIEEYRAYKNELEDLIKKHGLLEHVRFTGWRKDALNIASLADIVLHPSLAEGFGRAVLEAMALGKPVVASAVGGLREAIKDGENGFLIAPGDVDALAARWRLLLSDEKIRAKLGEEARRSVFADYLIDDKVKRLSEIWRVMGKKTICVE
ncbi:glycosyltransferase family 4 protein [bacterium]|nr:glycosyltransferase family 4 protein [bacterium]